MRTRLKLALALTGAAALAAGAVAVAQARGEDREAERRAFLEDAAGRLGVDELETALREAAIARVDAAVEAGDLTEERAAELKERIRSGDVPMPGFHAGPGFGFGHGDPAFLHGGPGFLDAAASYLGLDADELRAQLAEGESLTDLAEGAGKSVDGLEDALLERARARLDGAVEDGVLTRERADAILERVESRVDELVDRTFHRGPWRHRFGAPPDRDSSSEDTVFQGAA